MMPGSRTVFGHLPGGRAVTACRIGAEEGLSAEILDYGSTLRRLVLRTPQGPKDLVLGLPSVEAYVRDEAYLGVVAGRVANRIAGAAFELEGRRVQLVANEGPNQLHGGRLGFGKRPWRLVHQGVDVLVLALTSPEGEEGFPGRLEVQATWRVEGLRLTLALEASTDAPTPVSLTGHGYFNLSGDTRRPLAGHRLRIPASRYLPVGPGLIPLGEAAPVAGTPFDFRRARTVVPESIDHPQLRLAGGYDHCWWLDPQADCAAELACDESGIVMRIGARQPGLQFYGGQGLPRQQPGLGHGLCLEPQGLPNAVNEARFPGIVLPAGGSFHELIDYRFELVPRLTR